MSQFERYQPLAFTAARAAFDDVQIEKSSRLDRGAESVVVAPSNPHVVTRGSGTLNHGGAYEQKNRFSPYKPGVAEQSRWDWYQSTVEVTDPGASGLVDCLLKHWEFSDFVPAKNLNGYHFGGQIVRGEKVLCHLCWGGQPGVNCKTTSDESHVLAKALKAFDHPHRPTRVDSCIDWEEDKLFDTMAKALIKFAKNPPGLKQGLKINMQGDWIRGIARTLYVGSTSSPVRLVLYEKGYEQGGDAPLNWVRLEARVRPNKAHREEVSTWLPEHAFAAGWIADAAKMIGLADLEKRAVGTVWKATDDEKTRFAMLKQYGPALRKWLIECGGDCEKFGRQLAEALSKNEKTGGDQEATGEPQDASEIEVQNAANERVVSGAQSGSVRSGGLAGRAVRGSVHEGGEQRRVSGESRSSERSGQSDLQRDGADQSARHSAPSVAGRGENAQLGAGGESAGTEGLRGRSSRADGGAEGSDRSLDFDRPADAGDVERIGRSPDREGSPSAEANHTRQG